MKDPAMKDPQEIAEILSQTFINIEHEQMAGIPILNRMLKVMTLGFQRYNDSIIGIVITPWMMNLLMLPDESDYLHELELGKKLPQQFPSKTLKFMVNEFDGVGRCLTHSLFSPMNEFINQDHALAAAQSFLDTLMVEVELSDEDIIDEELLGRIMRGEETPEVNLDEFAVIEATEAVSPVRGTTEMKVLVDKKLTRRELLRGNFRSGT